MQFANSLIMARQSSRDRPNETISYRSIVVCSFIDGTFVDGILFPQLEIF